MSTPLAAAPPPPHTQTPQPHPHAQPSPPHLPQQPFQSASPAQLPQAGPSRQPTQTPPQSAQHHPLPTQQPQPQPQYQPQSQPQQQPFNPAQPYSNLSLNNINLNGLALPPTLTNGSNAAGPSDPAVLQARLAMAQQAAQANMQQRQQNRQAQADGAQGLGQGQGLVRPPQGGDAAGGQWANMANMLGGMGLLNNAQGQNKEAIMKQLQALQTSQMQRARLAQGIGGSQAAMQGNPNPMAAPSPRTAPSPVPGGAIGAPSPATSMTAPSPAASLQAPPPPPPQPQTPSSSSGQQMQNGQPPQQPQPQLQQPLPTYPNPHQQLQQQQPTPPPAMHGGTPVSARPPPPPSQTPHPQMVQQPGTPVNAQGPGQGGGAAARSPTQQRRSFVATLANLLKSQNVPLPPELFNGEKEGMIKLGGVWVDVVELFMSIMRLGGIGKVLKSGPEHPFFQAFLASKNVPNPLPEPMPLPRAPQAPPNIPQHATNNPIQYLIAFYLAYLSGFEAHITQQKQKSSVQRQAAMAAATGIGRPPSTPGIMGSPAVSSIATPSPAQQQGFRLPSMPDGSSPAPTSTPTAEKRPKGHGKHAPMPIRVDGVVQAHQQSELTPTGKKRKRDKKAPSSVSTSVPPSPAISIPPPSATPVQKYVPPPPERPPTPKRARYKVEYRPLHYPVANLAGWDERAVASTFPKHNIGQPTRSIHDLGIVDMEAVLMGLRSRLPREMGYALTVLSMLSMPHPGEGIGGLPLEYIKEVYQELLDLVGEAAFGEHGYDAWEAARMPNEKGRIDELNRLSYVELERLGKDFDFSLDDDEAEKSKVAPRDRTGGPTDTVLTGLNLLRNFSMMPENQRLMASNPDTFPLLARICDARLARLPGQAESDVTTSRYSLLELARVRRDVVAVLTNLGHVTELSAQPAAATLSVWRVLATFLSSGWAVLQSKESAFGPLPSLRDAPLPVVLSLNRSLEAFAKLAASDANREVLGKVVPAPEILDLFHGLLKLFPTSPREIEAMFSLEDYLGFTECLALATYSLVFLAPPAVRAEMRQTPGVSALFTRLITSTAHRQPADFKQNPFRILCRRLCETLGVMNGSVTASGDVGAVAGGMGFSAGSGAGKGWRFNSEVVEKGWLAGTGFEGDWVLGVMGVRGLDSPAFGELDAGWWGA